MKSLKWKKSKFGQMTFENICRLFSSDKNLSLNKEPPFVRRFYVKNEKGQYAVSWNKYEEKADFSGFGKSRTEFIIQGKCEVKIAQERYRFEKGEYFECSEGEFHFKVIECPYEYVSVCELPEDFSIEDAISIASDSE